RSRRREKQLIRNAASNTRRHFHCIGHFITYAAMKIEMDFALTEDQRMLVDAASQVSKKHIQPLLESRDKDTALDKQDVLDILSKAADIGLTSARIPEEGGGMGLKMLDYGLIMEQMPPTVGLIVQPH